MTTGSSNHHSLYPRDEREALSALFDGELPADAARFALKRLDHDEDWRETCGRWQLIGDLLRGEATAVAPVDFAQGVMRSLAGEKRHLEAAPVVPAAAVGVDARARRRWLGGAALAASVAVVAALAVRPFMQTIEPTVQQANVATSLPTAPQSSDSAINAPAAPAVVAGPQRAVATTALPQRPAIRATRTPSRPVRRAETTRSATDEMVAATASTSDARPFHPSSDDIVTRPWPRAVLPNAAAGAVTVGFGEAQASAQSFYPFEPRLPAEVQAAEPQR